MGFFDRAKSWLGIGAGEKERAGDDETIPAKEAGSRTPRTDGQRGRVPRGRDGKDRPPLLDTPPPPSATSDDALAARDAGDREEARRILREIDRGQGLRTVLRAAAALEAGDEGELAPLLDVIAKETPTWRLLLQVAGAIEAADEAAPYLARATRAGAPGWALAWARATSKDLAAQREGLVDLLFADAALARTVARRDLAIEGVVADTEAAQRYASFAHGRDSIRRFGASVVAAVLDRAGVG